MSIILSFFSDAKFIYCKGHGRQGACTSHPSCRSSQSKQPSRPASEGNHLALPHEELEKVKQQLTAVNAVEEHVTPSIATLSTPVVPGLALIAPPVLRDPASESLIYPLLQQLAIRVLICHVQILSALMVHLPLFLFVLLI